MNQRQLLWLRIALGALLVVIFAPSISASLVWDDRYLLGDNPALDDLGLLLSSDIFSATSAGKSDVYRPLVMLTYWLGHQIGWGAVGASIACVAACCPLSELAWFLRNPLSLVGGCTGASAPPKKSPKASILMIC